VTTPLAAGPPTHRRILLIDDDRAWTLDFSALLGDFAETALAHDEPGAFGALSTGVFDAVLLDLSFGGKDLGFTLLEKILQAEPTLPVLMLTSNNTARAAMTAVRRGAFDYLVKGCAFEEVQTALLRAFQHRDLKQELRQVKARLREEEGAWIGAGLAFQQLRADVERVAAASTPVLIIGETGTGKGVLARWIHSASGRPGEAVLFHASAARRSAEELIDAELFGALKGSHSMADRDREGLARFAGRGTLVLDDIDDLPAGTQAKLLELLEDRIYRPLGATRPCAFEARILATAKPSLPQLVASGAFRSDLYYRIDVYPIEIPPLRERLEDVLVLADHFLARSARENKIPCRSFSDDARRWLVTYPWPGNVRELKNAIEAAVLRCQGSLVRLRDFPGRTPRLSLALAGAVPGGGRPVAAGSARGASAQRDWRAAQAALQCEYVQKLLEQAEGNVSRAARMAGMTRSGFQRLRKRLQAGSALGSLDAAQE
jgi:DNA-binding NtrC family response regulator